MLMNGFFAGIPWPRKGLVLVEVYALVIIDGYLLSKRRASNEEYGQRYWAIFS